MQDPDDNLTPKQLAVLALLLAGATVEAAAQQAGCDPSTIHRWLGDATFASAYQRRRRQLVDETMSVLLAVGRSAAGTVLAVMTDATVSPAIRLRAALAIVDQLHRWAELEDLEQRIAALEGVYAPTKS